MFDLPPVPAARPSHPLRRPEGLLGLLGLVVLAIGALLPWATAALPAGGTVVVNGFTAASDGGMGLLFGVLLGLALASRTVSASRTRLVQLLPGLLGATSLAFEFVALRSLPITMELLQRYDPEPVLGVGMWIALAGSGGCCVAGLIRSAWIVRRNPVRPAEPGDRSALDRSFAASAATWLGCILLGAAAGVWLALQLYRTTASPFVPLLGLAGGLVGAVVATIVQHVQAARQP